MNAKPLCHWLLIAFVAAAVSSADSGSVTAQQNQTQSIAPDDNAVRRIIRPVLNSQVIRQDPVKQDPVKPAPGKNPLQDQNDPNQANPNVQMPKLGNVIDPNKPLALNFQDPAGNALLPPSQDVIRPSKKVAEEFAGWREAGEGYNDSRLREGLRANWVMVDPSGRLSGQVLNHKRGSMRIHLLRRGRLQESTDLINGAFSFTGVKQAAYTIVGFSDNHFFAFSFDAISFRDGAGMPTGLRVAALPARWDFNAAWVKRFSPLVKFRNYGVFTSKQTAADPARLLGSEGLHNHAPAAVAATSIINHPVAALSDGRLVGRIHQIDSLNGRPVDVLNTTIVLTSGTDIVQHTSVDNFGVFEFSNIKPGEYGLFAAGSDGIAAIGITVIDQIADGAPSMIDFSLVSSESVGWINHYLTEADYLNRLLTPRSELAQRVAPAQPTGKGQSGSHPPTNEQFHRRCQSQGFQGCRGLGSGNCQGCQSGQCNGGCANGGCGNGGCGNGGCANGGCANGGCANGSCLPGSKSHLDGLNGYRYPREVGAAYQRCEHCGQYLSICQCAKRKRIEYVEPQQKIELRPHGGK